MLLLIYIKVLREYKKFYTTFKEFTIIEMKGIKIFDISFDYVHDFEHKNVTNKHSVVIRMLCRCTGNFLKIY